MIDPISLIDACEHCYAYPQYKAGPGWRDAATVTKIGGQSVLVFRGTLTEGAAAWLDWLNDLRSELIYSPDVPGLVHAGFLHAVENLLLILPRFCREPAPIVVGHSKGGAMAVIFALRLFARFGLKSKVVTFGAPRAGNDGFAAAVEEFLDVDRYENPHDLVPRLPPADYSSAGYLISPPATWTAPRTVVENHSLETGYRPWIATYRPPPAMAA